ncbi:MAG: GNAT family N-acetyltransferase [Solirubrobacteraceae bacterium]
MQVRAVGPADLELICHHREEMFRDAGSEEQLLAEMTGNFRPWLEPRLADGSYFGFILTCDGEPAAGVGLMLIDWPPHPLHPTHDWRGYVLNLFVEPEHRRSGLARRLMQLAEEELASRGVSLLILHATDKGRPLYSQLGWLDGSAEMVKRV